MIKNILNAANLGVIGHVVRQCMHVLTAQCAIQVQISANITASAIFGTYRIKLRGNASIAIVVVAIGDNTTFIVKLVPANATLDGVRDSISILGISNRRRKTQINSECGLSLILSWNSPATSA